MNSITAIKMWAYLGWTDVLARYRRTILGPIWNVLITLFMISALAVVYSTVFSLDLDVFFPFVCSGIIIWQFISGFLIDVSAAYSSYKSILMSRRVPLFLVIVRILSRNLILFLHNVIIAIAVVVLYKGLDLGSLIYFIFGFVHVVAFLFCSGVILAFLCARYADFAQLIVSAIGMLFLITPVLWDKKLLIGKMIWLADSNPLAHAVAVLRDPLLYTSFPLHAHVMLSLFVLTFACVAKILYVNYERKVMMWL